MLASFITFDEPLTLRHLVGLAVALLGLAFMMRVSKRKADTTGAKPEEPAAADPASTDGVR